MLKANYQGKTYDISIVSTNKINLLSMQESDLQNGFSKIVNVKDVDYIAFKRIDVSEVDEIYEMIKVAQYRKYKCKITGFHMDKKEIYINNINSKEASRLEMDCYNSDKKWGRKLVNEDDLSDIHMEKIKLLTFTQRHSV